MLPLHVVLFILKFFPQEAPVDTWNYDDTEAWKKLYPLCGGPFQSPIDLTKDRAVRAPPIRVIGSKSLLEGEAEAFNNGRRIELTITVPEGGKPALQIASKLKPLQGRYALQEYHFHWGDAKGTPGSEHSIEGKFFAAEAHLVFFDRKFDNIDDAKRVPGGVAVVSVPLSRIDKHTEAIFPTFGLEDRLDELAARDDRIRFKTDLTPLAELVHVALTQVLTYKGSLTTPTCNPVVIWLVSTVDTGVSGKFLNGLVTKIFQDKDKTKPLVNNFRPLQDREGRKVTARFSFSPKRW